MVNEEIDVSVCMLTYNHEKYISQAIESILSQKTNYKYEIVVSDDCSQDETRNIVNKYKKKFPEIIVTNLQSENQGIPRNLYSALCKCRGRYITILSGDDYWISDDRIEMEAKFLDKNSDFQTVSTAIEARYDDELIAEGIYPKGVIFCAEFTINDFLRGLNFSTSTIMFRNNVMSPEESELYKLIPMASQTIDDLTFCWILLKMGKLYLSDKCTAVYRMHRVSNNNMSNFNSLFKGINSLKMHIKLINYLDEYEGGRVNFINRYALIVQDGLRFLRHHGKFYEIVYVYKLINKKYRVLNNSALLKALYMLARERILSEKGKKNS